MRKFVNCYFVALSCLSAVLFSACNDDDYSGPSPDKVTARYSNKLSPALNTLPLELTYSGREFYGNEVYFDTSDGVTGTLNLFGVFAGEERTDITGVALTGSGDKYSFSGNGTSNKGTTFKYDGEVTESGLSLNLTDVQVVSNELSLFENLYVVPHLGRIQTTTVIPPPNLQVVTEIQDYNTTKVVWDIDSDNIAAGLEGIVYPIISRLINSVIYDVNFQNDGNITAKYAPLPDDTDLLNDFVLGDKNLYDRPQSDWISSPLNLVNYYLSDGVMFVRPNIDMIIREVLQNRSRADLDLINIITSLPELLKLYETINNWVKDGIELNLNIVPGVEITYPSATATQYQEQIGDYLISIGQKEIQPLFNILPLIKEFLPENIMTMVVTPDQIPGQFQALFPDGINVGELLEELINDITYNTKEFELGIFFSKEILTY